MSDEGQQQLSSMNNSLTTREVRLRRHLRLPETIDASAVFDLIAASLAVFLLLLLLALAAAAIWLDSPGPVLFRQTRTGRDGRTFRIFKFRTMRVMDNGALVRQATANDERATRIGRILRRTSIDELPQLLNVLRGEMSLVGPRPHALAHDQYYARIIPGYNQRFKVKPGITGWAQVNGARGETPTIECMQRRIDLDLWYVRNRSFTLNLQILARTVLSEVLKMNGY